MSSQADLILDDFVRPLEPRPAPRDALTFALSLKNPKGEFAGQPYNPAMHPGQIIFLVVYVLCGFRNWVLCADAQSGKSWLIQVMLFFHTCELGRDVLYGLPDMRFASDVWHAKIEEAMGLSGLAAHLPDSGSGSGGGADIDTVYLKDAGSINFHGANGKLKGGGNDGRTIPTIINDEFDSLPRAIIKKNEARADSYFRIGRRFRASVVKDDEVSNILIDYDNSAKATLVYQCPHCQGHTSLDAGKTKDGGAAAGFERFNVDTTSDESAFATATLTCIACGVMLTETDRQTMLGNPRVIFAGQNLDRSGRVIGDTPTDHMVNVINATVSALLAADRTEWSTILANAERFPTPPGSITFGLRWCRFDNPFKSLGDTAQSYRGAVVSEQAGNSVDLEHFYHEVLARQFPRKGAEEETTAAKLAARSSDSTYDRGHVPAEALFTTANIDQQKRLLLYLVKAHDRDGRTWRTQWGQIDICGQREEPTPDQRIAALNKVYAILRAGLPHRPGTTMSPVLIGLDVAEWPDLVAAWARAKRDVIPIHGTGRTQVERMKRGDGKRLEFLEGWYDLREQDSHGGTWKILWLDTDHVKHELARAFARPAGGPASAMLPKGLDEHSDLIQHLSSEKWQKNPKTGRHEWKKVGPFNDHWDNDYVTQAIGMYFRMLNPRYEIPNPNKPKGGGGRSNDTWGSGLGWT